MEHFDDLDLAMNIPEAHHGRLHHRLLSFLLEPISCQFHLFGSMLKGNSVAAISLKTIMHSAFALCFAHA